MEHMFLTSHHLVMSHGGGGQGLHEGGGQGVHEDGGHGVHEGVGQGVLSSKEGHSSGHGGQGSDLELDFTDLER